MVNPIRMRIAGCERLAVRRVSSSSSAGAAAQAEGRDPEADRDPGEVQSVLGDEDWEDQETEESVGNTAGA